jgi:hypothetical protein
LHASTVIKVSDTIFTPQGRRTTSTLRSLATECCSQVEGQGQRRFSESIMCAAGRPGGGGEGFCLLNGFLLSPGFSGSAEIEHFRKPLCGSFGFCGVSKRKLSIGRNLGADCEPHVTHETVINWEKKKGVDPVSRHDQIAARLCSSFYSNFRDVPLTRNVVPGNRIQ